MKTAKIDNRHLLVWRRHKGLTQDKAAWELGLSLRTLQGYEAGKNHLPETVKRLLIATWPADAPPPVDIELTAHPTKLTRKRGRPITRSIRAMVGTAIQAEEGDDSYILHPGDDWEG